MAQRHVTDQRKPFKKLPKRHRDFVKAYVRCGDAKQAYVDVGYKPGHTVAAGAGKLLKELTWYIDQEIRKYAESTELAVLGLKHIRELAASSDSDQVRFNAAKEMMKRALPEEAKEQRITVEHTHKNLTNEEIDNRLKQLQDELFIDAPALEVVK